ncbi:MAG: valine--tRNA ligase [Actinobacteria bacterium]|jgi:valyl-tRNA synthetase|uniref:valine--tRNA ligase n=1 Tax=freshwater metagenome TaxID=449393 RepID=A0A6J6C1T4_9ZZZZ|nr:valine--tRNA ligase [Actinomycetota bacterium]
MSSPNHIPDKPSLDGIEDALVARWDDEGVYRFDRSATRDQVFAIDTPPPTVSGSLHIGHVFSYTHTDTVARFQRMRGKAVFYPIGWDDNGLATERRVQNFTGVRCDPSLPFDPDFAAPFHGDVPKDHRAIPVSRPNFVELCREITHLDEQAFEALFRRLGLSVDWSLLYTTIGDVARRVSQRAFLRNLARGEAYQQDAPTLYDIDERTAVAQAEMEDRDVPGAYHQLAFHRTDGQGDLLIDTTRPELLPSCVAMVAHPDDARYQPLFGTTVRTPLFGVEVPVLAHHLADPEKGTGIAMICTFGDVTDVTWWRELNLPSRALIGFDGRMATETPEWITDAAGQEAYAQLAGLAPKQAQKKIVELLQASGEMLGDPRPISHPVKFYERGSRPLEIVATRQWYIRNGGRDADLRTALLERGNELTWHPSYMQHRYDNWVGGLNGDWLISRQRYFGVPIPVWYGVDADGNPDHDTVLLPADDQLPVDPSTDCPPGYTPDQRGVPGGFVGDPDVMDTWATSSLTPQIAGDWAGDSDLFDRVFPMDVRPQGHDIIRTWLFATMVRGHHEHGTPPWRHAALSGWILDPDRKKMSKSKGNTVTPMHLLEQYGTDAVRYWAACGRPGVDTAFDEGQMKIGRKLALKLLNVSKFVLGFGEPAEGAEPTVAIDRAMLARLGAVLDEATAAFDAFDYARALERTESFFWWFCDDYVELVKARAYGTQDDAGAQSARVALRLALSALTRAFAPVLPFVTDEVWRWWQTGSVHAATWPTAAELGGVAASADAAAMIDPVSEVLAQVRRAKTEAKVSQRAAIESLVVRGPAAARTAVEAALADLRDAGSIDSVVFEDADQLGCAVTLAPPAEG